MKKILLTICAIMAAISSFAAKANSFPFTISQPDGTQLTVILHGDENINWYTTTDGMLVLQNGNGYYAAVVNSDGSLSATNQLAHEALTRSTEERNIALSQDRTAFAKYAEERLGQPFELYNATNSNPLTKEMQIRNLSTLFPHTGSPKALVILVEFSDTTFTIGNPKLSFNEYLNNDSGGIVSHGYGEQNNPKGVRGYFKDVSFGQFTPQFDLVGPVRLANPLAYYGKGGDNMKALFKDACTAVDDSVDFSKYDANNDGYVDLVYIIYAGHSQSETGNSSDDIWPKSGGQALDTCDGKVIYRYGVNNELSGSERSRTKRINGIGLFCHEFSHTMGLPDIYATSGSTGYNKDDFGMEYWDLMDGGEYVRSGRYPTAYTAWEREVMGWMNVDTLSDTTHVDMAYIDKKAPKAKAYKVLNDSVRNEAMYLQNIQNKKWNTYLPGHGLLAYRVSYAKDDVNYSDRPNNGTKPRVVVIPADGKLGAMASYAHDSSPVNYFADMAGDTYPGTTGADSILSFTTFSGTTVNKPVLNIAEDSAGIVSFDFLGVKKVVSNINNVEKPLDIKPADNRIFSITGAYLGTDKTRLPKGIYIVNKKKIIIK